MGYDLRLAHSLTGRTITLNKGLMVHSNNVPVEYDAETGMFTQIPSDMATLGITYNYAKYYNEATEGDSRFDFTDDEGIKRNGLYGLNDKTPAEAIELIGVMIQRIREKYTDDNDMWVLSKREKTIYSNKDGVEVDYSEVLRRALNGEDISENYTIREETYYICENDTTDYWEATAMNAILSLQAIVKISLQCIAEDCYWEVF